MEVVSIKFPIYLQFLSISSHFPLLDGFFIYILSVFFFFFEEQWGNNFFLKTILQKFSQKRISQGLTITSKAGFHIINSTCFFFFPFSVEGKGGKNFSKFKLTQTLFAIMIKYSSAPQNSTRRVNKNAKEIIT